MRYLGEKKVVIVMNGTSNNVEIALERYAETFNDKSQGLDIISNQQMELSNTLKLTPKQTIVLEMN